MEPRVLVALVLSLVPMGVAAQPVGDTAAGLPGVLRLGIPVAERTGVRVAGEGGYGLLEPQQQSDGVHHRLSGRVAVGVAPVPFFGLALQADGHFNHHSDDLEGKDHTLVGDPRVVARLGVSATSAVAVGIEGELWMPGTEAPSVDPDATTVTGRLLTAISATASTKLVAMAGYRYDRSAQAVDDASVLRASDRLSLGLSDYDAFLIGFGAAHRLGAWELLGEIGSDVLLGTGAPNIAQMPMHISLGARYHLAQSLAVAFSVEASPSGRPSQGPDDRLAPIEPRAMMWAGLRYVLPLARASETVRAESSSPRNKLRAATGSTTSSAVSESAGKKPVSGKEESATVDEPTSAGTVIGRVHDEHDGAIAHARLVVLTDEDSLETKADAEGNFRFEAVAPGRATITATARGFSEVTRPIHVGADRITSLELPMALDNPEGQLRGTVRSRSGRPLRRATAKVYPGGAKTKVDAQGRFRLDVKPGSYKVRLRAYGYQSQNRSVVVRKNGVVVLNVELRKK